MKPEGRVWRKTARRAMRGVRRGRRSTHRVVHAVSARYYAWPTENNPNHRVKRRWWP